MERVYERDLIPLLCWYAPSHFHMQDEKLGKVQLDRLVWVQAVLWLSWSQWCLWLRLRYSFLRCLMPCHV